MCIQQYSYAACETLSVKTNPSSLRAFSLLACLWRTFHLRFLPLLEPSVEHVKAFGHRCSWSESWKKSLVIYFFGLRWYLSGATGTAIKGNCKGTQGNLIAPQTYKNQDCNQGTGKEERGRQKVAEGWGWRVEANEGCGARSNCLHWAVAPAQRWQRGLQVQGPCLALSPRSYGTLYRLLSLNAGSSPHRMGIIVPFHKNVLRIDQDTKCQVLRTVFTVRAW